MSVVYPPYKGAKADDEKILNALSYADPTQPERFRLGTAFLVAGSVRHPERRRNLLDHLGGLAAVHGYDSRPFIVQVAMDVLGEDIVWPPVPPAPKVKPEGPPRKGKKAKR